MVSSQQEAEGLVSVDVPTLQVACFGAQINELGRGVGERGGFLCSGSGLS